MNLKKFDITTFILFRGNEPFAEEVVQLICQTGGIAALAHPWALKNPVTVIRSLKTAGLHAMEVYRSDGKAAGVVSEPGTLCHVFHFISGSVLLNSLL